MLSLLISLTLALILFAVLLWAIQFLQLPEIVRRVAIVLFVVFAVVWLIYALSNVFGWVHINRVP